jgi:hypothetical protein
MFYDFAAAYQHATAFRQEAPGVRSERSRDPPSEFLKAGAFKVLTGVGGIFKTVPLSWSLSASRISADLTLWPAGIGF